MSETDRQRWDERYASGEYVGRTWPSALLERWMPRLPRGRALDVACGAGRNALFLAGQGYTVDAVDVSEVALERGRETAKERGLAVSFIQADLDAAPLPADRYQVIVVARFLDRRLCPRLAEALAEGGHLVYEQHLQTEATVDGPRSREFRLRPQELLHLFWPLRVLHYEESLDEDREGRRMALASLVACRGNPGF
jgi:tellurite methyltransferase